MPHPTKLKITLVSLVVCLSGLSALLFWNSPTTAVAQNPAQVAAASQLPPQSAPATTTSAPAPPQTNAPSSAAKSEASAPQTNDAARVTVQPSAPASPTQPAAVPAGSLAPSGAAAAQTNATASAGQSSDDIQLSFQGANIEMIVQWLAKTTGKSVVKHPRVQCQLTIVSSKKLPSREAINLVYRALNLEGFTAIESSKSILIVPEGQEPKLNPELLDGSQSDIPEGRQRLIKVFPLKHIQPAELRDKIRPVLSDRAIVELDDRASQLIVTDYNDNLRLLGELIKELDVTSVSDTVVEIYTVKYSQAEDLASLLTLILNAQAGAPPTPSRPSTPPPSSGPPPDMGLPPGVRISPGGGPSPASAPAPSSSGPSFSGGQQTGQQVKIWSDKTTNRLIVSAPRSKLPEVKKLLDILDVDKPQDVAVRVIPLKIVSAEDLVKEIGTLYQKMSGKSLKDTIEIVASSRANSLIVLSSEANFKNIEKLIATLDTEDAQEKVMRAFPLKNADAEDVAKQLQELSQDQQSSSRYYYYFYPPPSGRSGKRMNVVADRRRNTVIIQAPPGQMESIAKMVKDLDAPVTDNSLALKIYALKYVSAVDIEDVLNELFLRKQQARPYWYYFDEYPQDQADRNVGRLYGKVRITSEPYSNSIIVTANSQEHLAAVEEVLKQLDVPSHAGDTTVRIGLKFAQAVPVASSINILFARGGSPALRPQGQQPQPQDARNQQQQSDSTQSSFELERETKEDAYFPWLGGQQENSFRSGDGRSTTRPVSDLVGRVRIVPDRRSNSLLVTANVHLLPQVLKLVNDLDTPTAQVLIEAKIVEVSSDFRDKLGVRWSPDGSKTFNAEDLDNALMAKGSSAYQNVFLGSKMAESLRSGVLDASVNLDVLIQFLRKTSDSKVLAEPHLNIEDNELGRLFVGAQVPFLAGSVINNTGLGGRNDTFRYRDVGIILEVTPHINDNGEVALKIRAESSTIRPGETLFGAAILDTRNFRTDLMVKDGETVVLGGIIQQEEVDTVRKVPLLGSIPGLGWAFKKKDKVTRDVELMVFLRPRVTRTPEQVRALLQDIEKRTPRSQQAKEESATRKK